MIGRYSGYAWLASALLWSAGCSSDDPSGTPTMMGPPVGASPSAGFNTAAGTPVQTPTNAGGVAPTGGPPPGAMADGSGMMTANNPPVAPADMGASTPMSNPPPMDAAPVGGGMGTTPGQPTPPENEGVPLPTPRMGETCLQAGNGTYEEPGPYKVGQMDIDLGMIQDGQHTGMFTIFYPMPFEANCLHPIVAWGNGTTVMGSAIYAFFNTNAASWGIVVAASHEDNTGSGAFHRAGLDWLIAQNDDPNSMFYQKLSPRAGVSGHSQGGFGASAGARHPNVQAQVSVGAGGTGSEKVAVLVLTGTEDIVRSPEGQVTRATGPSFVASWDGGDHVVTETIAGFLTRDPGTLQMQRFYSAWFRCFLADDSNACTMFEGGAPDNCGVCSEPGWAVLASNNL